MSTFLEDEENVGSDGSVRGSHITVRVGVSTKRRSFEKRVVADSEPGNAVRVSVRMPGCDSSARILAFVDPSTGKAVVRMGMFDVSEDRRGHEVGPQIVWDSDEPIFDIKK